MILSDRDIKARSSELIDPFDVDSVQPSSYDLTLDSTLLIPTPGCKIDLRVDDPAKYMQRMEFDEYILKPGACVLGSTAEIIKCPLDLSSRIEGKSSLGRLFMAVHITAGVIDAGWDGQITLEIVNHGTWEIVLWKAMKIAQVSYFKLSSICEVPYGTSKLGSHYLGQRGPTPAAGRRNKQKSQV